MPQLRAQAGPGWVLSRAQSPALGQPEPRPRVQAQGFLGPRAPAPMPPGGKLFAIPSLAPRSWRPGARRGRPNCTNGL